MTKSKPKNQKIELQFKDLKVKIEGTDNPEGAALGLLADLIERRKEYEMFIAALGEEGSEDDGSPDLETMKHKDISPNIELEPDTGGLYQ